MAQRAVAAIDSTLQKTQQWIRDLQEIGHFDDEAQAYASLRAVLHTLRDRLVIEEATDLGAQLPMLIRGMYYEGWNPSITPTLERSRQEFLDTVDSKLARNARLNAQRVTTAVFELLDRRITAGEIRDVREMLPRDVRQLWPSQAGAPRS